MPVEGSTMGDVNGCVVQAVYGEVHPFTGGVPPGGIGGTDSMQTSNWPAVPYVITCTQTCVPAVKPNEAEAGPAGVVLAPHVTYVPLAQLTLPMLTTTFWPGVVPVGVTVAMVVPAWAANVYHTDWPPAEVLQVVEPSLVAPSVVPVTQTSSPEMEIIEAALVHKSFEGGVSEVTHRSNWPVGPLLVTSTHTCVPGVSDWLNVAVPPAVLLPLQAMEEARPQAWLNKLTVTCCAPLAPAAGVTVIWLLVPVTV